MAKVKRFVFKILGLHLNRQMVNTEAVIELGAQFFEKFGLRDGRRVNHMRAERLAS